MLVERNFTDQISRFYREDGIGLNACRNVTFVVTDSCDLRCTYCYECEKGHSYMSKETAKQCIDMLFDMYEKDDPNAFINKETKSIILDFIGGEPLRAIDVIEYACDYFWHRALKEHHIWADMFKISMISNGEHYFEEKVQSFLKKYRSRLSFGITIDGDKEMHDACRIRPDGSGNWEKAHSAQMHYHTHFNERLGTKVTVSPDNLPFLDRTVRYFVEQGYDIVNANPIYEHEWTIEEGKIYYQKLKSIADYILQLDKEIGCSLFEEWSCKPYNPNENSTWCGGSGMMLAFDVEGNAYPCLRYMKMSLGDDAEPVIIGNCNDGIYNTPETIALKERMDKITRRTQSTDECFYCPVGMGCGTCTAWCYQKYGTMDKRDTSICWMHKARSLANVYFWNKYYQKIGANDNKFKMFLPKEDALKLIDRAEYDMLIEISV